MLLDLAELFGETELLLLAQILVGEDEDVTLVERREDRLARVRRKRPRQSAPTIAAADIRWPIARTLLILLASALSFTILPRLPDRVSITRSGVAGKAGAFSNRNGPAQTQRLADKGNRPRWRPDEHGDSAATDNPLA